MINQEEMDPKGLEQAAGGEEIQNVEETTPDEATAPPCCFFTVFLFSDATLLGLPAGCHKLFF